MKISAVFTRFWVRRPLFVMAAGMVAVAALETWHPGFGWLVALGFFIFLGILTNWRIALVGAVLGLLMIANVRWHESRQAAGEAWISNQGLSIAEGRLMEDARGENGSWSAMTELHGTGLFKSRVIWVGSGEPPPAGTEIRATGIFKSLEPERNPGAPDRMGRNRAEGIIGSFRASEMRQQRWTGPFSKQKAAIKKSFRESIVAGLDEEAAPAKVIRAVVIGEKSPDSLGLVRDFRESGTLHVFTVSGLHVAMMGSMVWALFRILNCPRRWVIPVIIASMFAYVWLTGNGPAAVRAAWMGAVFLGAFALRRRTDLLNALGAVLLLTVLWNPGMIHLPGVQLSYGVVAAIGLGTAIARRCFDWLAEEELLLPKSEMPWWQAKWLRFRQKLAEGFAVSLAASIGSAPLSMFHFRILTPVSVLATVALVAQVYVLLGIALVSALIHPLWPNASIFLNQNNQWVASACAKTAGAFASIPGAWTTTGRPDQETLVIYDLDYGSEAACFSSTAGNAGLIDSGGKFSLKGEVAPSLKNLGMNPDSVIFTHADAGHVIEPALLTEIFPICQVALGMARTGRSTAAAWEALDDPEIEVLAARTGTVLDFGDGVQAEVLLSPHDVSLGSVADDRTMVFMLHWNGWKILWLGDAGRLSEQELIASGADIRADLIVAGFHESDFSLTEPFLAAVDPQAIIIPRLPGSKMDAQRVRQMRNWQDVSFKTIDRQKTGGLTVTIASEGELLISGFLDGSVTRLHPR